MIYDTNIQDFDVAQGKITNIRSQFLVYKLRLFTVKMYPNFVEDDNFLRNLQPKYSDRQTNFKFPNGNEINSNT